MTRKVTYWVQKATYTVSPAVSNPGTLHTLSVVADWVCNIFTTPLMRLHTLHLLCFLSQIFTYNPFLLPDLMQDPCFILTSLQLLLIFSRSSIFLCPPFLYVLEEYIEVIL